MDRGALKRLRDGAAKSPRESAAAHSRTTFNTALVNLPLGLRTNLMMLYRNRVPLWASLLLLLVTTLPPANSADLRIAALLPDQNVFYDALYELVDMTIREEQADGVLAAHNVGLDYTIYEFDQGYLESDVGTFANNSVIGLIGGYPCSELASGEDAEGRGLSSSL